MLKFHSIAQSNLLNIFLKDRLFSVLDVHLLFFSHVNLVSRTVNCFTGAVQGGYFVMTS